MAVAALWPAMVVAVGRGRRRAVADRVPWLWTAQYYILVAQGCIHVQQEYILVAQEYILLKIVLSPMRCP